MAFTTAFILFSCTKEKKQPALQLTDLDTTVEPGEDFYQYANGGWLKTATIPADKSRYGSFDILREETDHQVLSLFEKLQAPGADTTSALVCKVRDFYSSGMDTATIDSAGFGPIKADLEQIELITMPSDIIPEVARMMPLGSYAPFYAYVGQDSKSVDDYILSLGPSGLGMPDKEYYFDESEDGKKLQEAYRTMVAQTFILLGREPESAKQIAQDIFDLEKSLATTHYTRLQKRDPNLSYNKMGVAELKTLAKGIDWELFFQNLGVDVPDSLIVTNPGYFTALDGLLTGVPVNVWKEYLVHHFIDAYASALHTPLRDARFAFYGKALSGLEQQRPRWEQVQSLCNSVLGDAVGQLYVEEFFPQSSKDRMLTMVENIRDAFRVRLQGLTWMSDSTKQKAIQKLDAMGVKIGFPDKWKDYSDLSISPTKYALNLRNASVFEFNENMGRLGSPVDRGEWFMNPHTVNAYYSPTMNEIVFPAAIIQPPFFYSDADDAVNYGAIGVVISHEITHGFDDQGRLFDMKGNLNEWWTKEDAERFNAATELLVTQFSAFEPVPGYKLDGKLTLGENIADYGGLTIAVNALKIALANDKKAAEAVIDGFTPYQRFFLSYAKVWRGLIREAELIRRIKEDVHSPSECRVNGAVYNIDEFYEAFPVKETSKYYRTPEQRPKIW